MHTEIRTIKAQLSLPRPCFSFSFFKVTKQQHFILLLKVATAEEKEIYSTIYDICDQKYALVFDLWYIYILIG